MKIYQHRTEYVMKKVAYMLSAKRENPAGFLNQVIAQDWKAPLGV